MIEFEKSSGNVFADLELLDADTMLIKSQLVAQISETIQLRQWSQQQAAEALGMTQPKLSMMLHGQFHDISEANLRNGLVRLRR